MLQSVLSKLSALETVALPVSEDDGVTVTVPPGSVCSLTMYCPAAPASVSASVAVETLTAGCGPASFRVIEPLPATRLWVTPPSRPVCDRVAACTVMVPSSSLASSPAVNRKVAIRDALEPPVKVAVPASLSIATPVALLPERVNSVPMSPPVKLSSTTNFSPVTSARPSSIRICAVSDESISVATESGVESFTVVESSSVTSTSADAAPASVDTTYPVPPSTCTLTVPEASSMESAKVATL